MRTLLVLLIWSAGVLAAAGLLARAERHAPTCECGAACGCCGGCR